MPKRVLLPWRVDCCTGLGVEADTALIRLLSAGLVPPCASASRGGPLFWNSMRLNQIGDETICLFNFGEIGFKKRAGMEASL